MHGEDGLTHTSQKMLNMSGLKTGLLLRLSADGTKEDLSLIDNLILVSAFQSLINSLNSLTLLLDIIPLLLLVLMAKLLN